MISCWFPRPESLQDLQILVGGSLSREQLFELLNDPQAQEWREKVGVRGTQEGSGKTTVRLLCSQNWVFKTDRSRTCLDPAFLASSLITLAETSGRLEIYHPQKIWFLLAEGEYWLPMTACPRLQTLRQCVDLEQRRQGWIQMYQMGLHCLLRYQIELDLNPANFGRVAQDGPLFYLDDEWYAGQQGLEGLGASLAHRMAEEALPEDFWQALGRDLRQILDTLGQADYHTLRAIQDSLMDYPLRGEAIQARHCFLARFLDKRITYKNTGSRPRRTCILADIHANLPALEAVLAEAHAMNVTDFLILGDVVGYGPHPEACVSRLAELPLMAAIRGNHDQAIITGEAELGARRIAYESFLWTQQQLSPQSRDWLARLPTHWQRERVMAIHGSLLDSEYMYGYIYEMTYAANLEKAEQLDLSLVFFGHSHFPLIYRLSQGVYEQRLPNQSLRVFEPNTVLLVNPGSVGQPRDRDNRAAFAIWEHDTQKIHFFRQAYPIERTQADLRRAGLDERLALRLREGI